MKKIRLISKIKQSTNRSSCLEVFYKKGVYRNFIKFTGKHLCQSFFLNKVAGFRPATLLKKRLLHICFPVNFVKFLRTPFFIEHLWWLLLHQYTQWGTSYVNLLCQIIFIKGRKLWSFDKERNVLKRHINGEKYISKLKSLYVDKISASSEFVRNVLKIFQSKQVLGKWIYFQLGLSSRKLQHFKYMMYVREITEKSLSRLVLFFTSWYFVFYNTWKTYSLRGVIRTPSNIYYRSFLGKELTAFSLELFSQKSFIIFFDMVLNKPMSYWDIVW